jgi:hypothetical protein
MIGLPFAFANTLMGIWWEDQLVGFPQITITLATLITLRDALPESAAGLLTSITDGIGDNLACPTTQHGPNPAFSPLLQHKGPHFIDFENVFSLYGKERLFNFWVLLVFF